MHHNVVACTTQLSVLQNRPFRVRGRVHGRGCLYLRPVQKRARRGACSVRTLRKDGVRRLHMRVRRVRQGYLQRVPRRVRRVHEALVRRLHPQVR